MLKPGSSHRFTANHIWCRTSILSGYSYHVQTLDGHNPPAQSLVIQNGGAICSSKTCFVCFDPVKLRSVVNITLVSGPFFIVDIHEFHQLQGKQAVYPGKSPWPLWAVALASDWWFELLQRFVTISLYQHSVPDSSVVWMTTCNAKYALITCKCFVPWLSASCTVSL